MKKRPKRIDHASNALARIEGTAMGRLARAHDRLHASDFLSNERLSAHAAYLTAMRALHDVQSAIGAMSSEWHDEQRLIDNARNGGRE